MPKWIFQKTSTDQQGVSLNVLISILWSQAIWYVPKFKSWAIGSLEKKGTTIRGITTVGNNEVNYPQDSGPWKYWNDYAWTSGGNDIIVECIDGMQNSVNQVIEFLLWWVKIC